MPLLAIEPTRNSFVTKVVAACVCIIHTQQMLLAAVQVSKMVGI